MQKEVVRSGVAKRLSGQLLAWWSGWPQWSAYAAAGWSLAYGALGLYWALGGVGFPFGRGNDQEAEYSVLVNASAETTAPVIAVLGLLGATVVFVMAKAVGRGFARAAVVVFAWAAAATLAVGVTDLRLLMLVTRKELGRAGWLSSIERQGRSSEHGAVGPESGRHDLGLSSGDGPCSRGHGLVKWGEDAFGLRHDASG